MRAEQGAEPVGTMQVRTVRIVVSLKPGVLDALGHPGVQNVRAGKYFEVELADDGRVEERVREMCEGFLANTLIEEYRYDIL